MAARIWSYLRQHESHRDLLVCTRPNFRRSPQARPDAIIVPASRSADNLDNAAALAGAVGCRLVVLCSLDARGPDVAKLLRSKHVAEPLVVDIQPGYTHPLLEFETSDLVRQSLPRGTANPNGDLSVKRNLGLLLARMAGWQRIFFMDDDIRDLTTPDLLSVAAMLDKFRVAGMQVDDFPDNSVVCHARRETGDRQDVFISGSVLAVDSAKQVGFFPEVYNEDWLFFYDDVRARRAGCLQRSAAQLRYDPFANPRRARRQEFGDVLAEGLYALIHKTAGHEEATRKYWANFIAIRRKLIEDIRKRPALLESKDRGNILSSLEGAVASLMKIQPQVCESYVKAWRRDLVEWRRRLSSVPATGSITDALHALGLERIEVAGAPPAALLPSPDVPLSREAQRAALVSTVLTSGVLSSLVLSTRVLRRKGSVPARETSP